MKPATPLPWYQDEQYIYAGPTGALVAVSWSGAHDDDTPITDEERHANAAHIVHACNAHERLVGALKALVGWHDMFPLREGEADMPIVAQARALLTELGEV